MSVLKGLMVAAVTLFCGFVFASPSGTIVLGCVTEVPTTSYFIVEQIDRYDLLIFHHNGVEYMPLFSGTITPHDLPMLNRRAKHFKKTGAKAVVSFKKDECKQKGILWQCYSKRPAQIGDLKVKGVGFSMGHMSSEFDGFKWSTIETFLHLQIEGEEMTSTVSLSFPEESCGGKKY